MAPNQKPTPYQTALGRQRKTTLDVMTRLLRENNPQARSYFEYSDKVAKLRKPPPVMTGTEFPIPVKAMKDCSLMLPEHIATLGLNHEGISQRDFEYFIITWRNWLDHAHRLVSATSATHQCERVFPWAKACAVRLLGGDLLPRFFIESLFAFQSGPLYELHPDLATLLSHTKAELCDDLPVAALKAPFDVLYLDWRTMADLPEDYQGTAYEGAYVTTTTQSVADWYELGLSERDASLCRAVEQGTILPQGSQGDVVTLSVLLMNRAGDSTLFPITFSPQADVTVAEAVAAHRRSEDSEAKLLSEGYLTLSGALAPMNLVLSTLLYLTSDDVERKEIKEGTEIAIKLKTSRNERKRRQLKERAKTAYDCVRIGRSYELAGQIRDLEQGNRKGDKRAVHLRSGHWHDYRAGAMFERDNAGEIKRDEQGNRIRIPASQRKLVTHWHPPKIVGAGDAEVSGVEAKKRIVK